MRDVNACNCFFICQEHIHTLSLSLSLSLSPHPLPSLSLPPSVSLLSLSLPLPLLPSPSPQPPWLLKIRWWSSSPVFVVTWTRWTLQRSLHSRRRSSNMSALPIKICLTPSAQRGRYPKQQRRSSKTLSLLSLSLSTAPREPSRPGHAHLWLTERVLSCLYYIVIIIVRTVWLVGGASCHGNHSCID